MRFFCLFTVAMLSVTLQTAGFTQSNDAVRTLSSRFIPNDALAVAEMRPSSILEAPYAKYLPTEVMDAWFDENVGIRVGKVKAIRVVAPMIMGGPPKGAAIIAFNDAAKLTDLKSDLVDLDQTVDIAGRKCHPLFAEPNLLIHEMSPTVWFLGTQSYLPAVFEANQENNSGPLATIVEEVPMTGDLQMVIHLEPLRPILNFWTAANIEDLPPTMTRLPELVDLFDAAWTSVDSRSMNFMTYGDWTIRAVSLDAADQAEQIIKQVVQDTGAMLVEMGQSSFPGDDKVPTAMRSYLSRVFGEIQPNLMPTRNGRLFSTSSIDTQMVATSGILVGLLLPAVQAARGAAQRMSGSNNMKMIGLSFHNYHNTHGTLPNAILSDSGEPLLSWRVAVLPFLDQGELYEKFHLDEPWNSEHNLTLVDEMPAVYTDPALALPSGLTIYQTAIGPQTMFPSQTEKLRFRDIPDGLSNTIMAVEASTPVTWTQPTDWTPDTTEPLTGTGDSHENGFHVLMGDGSVRFLSNTIDPALFNSLLTAAGKEVITDF